MQRWQALDRQRRLLLRERETTRVNAVGDRMIGRAGRLERDPQVESILHNRKAQVGLRECRAEVLARAWPISSAGGEPVGSTLECEQIDAYGVPSVQRERLASGSA